MNEGRVLPKSEGKLRTNGGHQSYSMPQSSMVASMPPLPSSVPLADERDSLLQEKLDLHLQLFEAAQIQRKLSGPRELRRGCLQFASEVFAARFLAGDFTSFLQSGSKVLVAHGDIAGKGVAAGMWFTNLAGLLQSYDRPHSDPARIASEINRHLCYLRPVAPFATAFLARVDCNLGELTYCNAGHFPPILLRADGRTELLERGGPLLGAIEGAKFELGKLILEPGDTLVAYSDGVLECRNTADEEFGLDRIVAALRGAKSPFAQATLMMLLATLQDFANGGPLCDDVSLTVIQRDATRRHPTALAG
ncbi:PP2C family protein-serine/threonine phosphatase [Tunturibacter empetritectus]|uniref:Sigma-B regulation protein RsbU (Phosphoserine phosphatase) n=1 Tax=Tunturiibacter empetritectus TaxID=3069691 RepID=A0A7W8IJQ4_9BACT|nr:PP2C family protein-serine/threonine phosphatase [Edaphobacter lichenicola]MBB5318410.1 sigma-B regulation protein RsbU (phosphoserine phosphatase) [Edaphobacter lichenicola]